MKKLLLLLVSVFTLFSCEVKNSYQEPEPGKDFSLVDEITVRVNTTENTRCLLYAGDPYVDGHLVGEPILIDYAPFEKSVRIPKATDKLYLLMNGQMSTYSKGDVVVNKAVTKAEGELSDALITAINNYYPEGVRNTPSDTYTGCSDLMVGSEETEVWDGGEHSAWFNPLSAAWYMTETDVRYENLPEPVLAAHKAGKYADWRVDDVDKLTREGMETLYVIEVEKGESELDLFYSSTGILVKTVVDTGHEEDYDDYLPQPDANGIIAIVKQKYPNATIVEIEREKGLQEVTILDENKEKEVYFNERNEWMGTSWDVQVANLPEAVKKSVMEKYSDYVIDDADYVVTPDNEWYILDLENKQIDKELKVKVDKDGVWL